LVAILTFFVVYSDWGLPTVMLRKADSFTLMMGIELLVSATYGKSWSLFAAGALLGSVLPVTVYIVLQDQIVGGLTSGSVKG
jgi:ABC-type maltose transport system permease subunit